MSKLKIEPFDDFKMEKRKADDYIKRILMAVSLFEHRFHAARPTIFMSADIFNSICRGSERAVMYNAYPRVITVCGYNVKLVAAENVLSIGIDLLERSGE